MPEDEKTDYIDDVASATECTGLIQIPPQNAYEEESYGQIYDVPNGKETLEKRKNRKKN